MYCPGHVTEECGFFLDSLTLLSLYPQCFPSPVLFSPFYTPSSFSFHSAFLGLRLKQFCSPACATPPPLFLCLGFSFAFYICEATVLSLWGRYIYCPHKHTLKLQGRSLAWGCSCQSNKLLLAGVLGIQSNPPPTGELQVCVHYGSNAPIICVMGNQSSVSKLCIHASTFLYHQYLFITSIPYLIMQCCY